MAQSSRIFASGVFGSDLDRWGAWSFKDRTTRNKLAAEIGPADYVLSVGTTGPETPPHERGRLLALMRIGPELIQTKDLVEPGLWQQTLELYGDRWPYGFPIRSAERFDPGAEGLPRRAAVLPRIDERNLYMALARYYVELTAEEVQGVLALPRTPESDLFTTPVSAFAARLLKARPGPPPSVGTRVLSILSGAASTYVMPLGGSALQHVVRPVISSPEHQIFKVGFSNDTDRRQRELNSYLPCEATLRWRLEREQVHEDEINAYAMEQRIFEILDSLGANRFKGELVVASQAMIQTAWDTALLSTQRPSTEVIIPA